MGTVQLIAVPVQPAYVEYVSPSLCLIYTVYYVTTEPPLAGATQVIATSVPEIAVVGAAGVVGATDSTATVIVYLYLTVGFKVREISTSMVKVPSVWYVPGRLILLATESQIMPR